MIIMLKLIRRGKASGISEKIPFVKAAKYKTVTVLYNSVRIWGLEG